MDYKIDEIFPEKFFCTLQKASLDTDKNIFMVDNEFIVLKLDDFNRKKYQKELGCSMCLRGGDACFEKNGKIYILEFKNTYLHGKVIYEILEKMYDSCIVLMDKLKIDISYFKNNVNFVTIYSFKEDCDEEKKYSEIDKIQNIGMNKIKSSISRRNSKPIKNIDDYAFGLKKLEKYIYNEVSAIPINYFQQFLKEEKII